MHMHIHEPRHTDLAGKIDLLRICRCIHRITHGNDSVVLDQNVLITEGLFVLYIQQRAAKDMLVVVSSHASAGKTHSCGDNCRSN